MVQILYVCSLRGSAATPFSCREEKEGQWYFVNELQSHLGHSHCAAWHGFSCACSQSLKAHVAVWVAEPVAQLIHSPNLPAIKRTFILI